MHKMTQPKIYIRAKKLWIRFSLDGEVIKRSLNLDNTKANIKLANTQIIPQMIIQVHSGEFFENIKDKMPLIDEFVYKSFEMHRGTRKLRTHNDCVSMYNNHIKEFFGQTKLDQLKPSDIKIWQNTLLDRGLSPARVKTIRSVLTSMYRDALEDEIVNRNPFTLVRVPKIIPPEIFPFSLKEIQNILSVTNGWLQNFLAVAFFTGARSGELLGLKWEDINFDKKEIFIKRSIKFGEISTPKTTSSTRCIDILDTLVPFLKNQFEITGKKNTFVFLNDKDEHIYDIKRVRETHWRRALKSAGLDYRPIYHTRHTFATVMIENNEDILWVANMLGHINSTMTLSRYARYIKRANKQRATFLEKMF